MKTRWIVIPMLAWLLCWSLAPGSVHGAATGLTGEYFDNIDFTSLKFTRTDPNVSFNWGAAAPTNTMGADTWSARWSGQLEPRYSEPYTFYVLADDGARLWVNGHLLLARTTYSAAAIEMCGRLNLQAGKRYDLVLEFIENTGSARVSLEWASPTQPRQVIPSAQLYPALGLPDTGTILAEHWMGLPGTNLDALTSSANYPNRPDNRESLITFECLQTNWADHFGTRVSGFLAPQISGDYSFAVSGDAATQLLLSTGTNPANLQLIASNNTPTGFRQFTTSDGQISTPVALQAHERYYVELRHKAGTGGDHFSVAWRTPGDTNFTTIPAEALVPAGLHRAPPAQTNYLNTLCPSHPRLLAGPERFAWLKQALAANNLPQLNSWWTTVSNSANSILSQPVSVYTQDDRGTILAISRTVVDRIYKCSLAWWMTGNTNFAERAWAELEQVASTNFPDWHPAHFLDTAEMTHGCAIGYDWLYDYWTETRRATIRTAIITKGLNQVLTLYTNNSGWVASSANNWNLVCNGGMILGALAVGTESEALSEYVLAKAVASASAVMRHYTADNGGWYEGPGYWDYTTEYNTRLLAALESALGSDFSLSDTRSLCETGIEPLYLVGPNRLSFNFADASAGNVRGPQLLWLARRFNRPEFSWHERGNASVEVLDLLWYDARGQDPLTAGLPADNCFRGPTGTTAYAPADAVTLRSRWQDSLATFAGFKAGEVGASHGHLDAGSFVLDALGVRWAHDLGADDYALSGYFSTPQRWTYYRLRAEGHNTLVINPGSSADQITGAKPPLVLFTSEPDGGRSAVVADLTSGYGISRAWRGLQLLRNRRWALVQDELQAATPADVWWFMHLNSSTTVLQTNGSSVLLSQGSGRLWLNILSGGGVFTHSNAVPLPTSPNPSGQNPNTGWHKLAIHLTNVTNSTLAVLLVPLSPGENPPTNLPALVPLADWGAGSTNITVAVTNHPPEDSTTNLTTSLNTFLDVELCSLVRDTETPCGNLLFTVGSPFHGAVTLLPDGHTARFVPASNYSGTGSFQFTVTDTWPDSRLLAHYDFEPPDAITNGFVPDRSGRGFYGLLTTVGSGTNYLDTNAPTALAPHDFQSLALRESGDFNGARLVAPVNPADLDFNFHDWTLAGWFKRTANTNDDFIFYLGNSDGFGSPDELHLYCPKSLNTLVVRHYIGEATTDLDLTASNIRVGEWHHAALTFHSTNNNRGTVALYVDGALAGSDPVVTLNLPSGMSCAFGGHASSTFAVTRWFNGRLDDLAVFTEALSPAEIALLARRPIAYLGGATATNTVSLDIRAPNQPPVLDPIADRAIRAGVTLLVTNTASDPNTPPHTLVFSLLSAPADASINPTNGLLTWRPAIAQSGSTNRFRVTVAQLDFATNTTLLSVTQSFVVSVIAPQPPTFGALAWNPDGFWMRIDGDWGPDFQVQGSTNLTDWLDLFTTNSPALPFDWRDPEAHSRPLRFYRIRLGP